jgi:hypothetical protein
MRLAGANCVARNLTFYKGTAATSGIVYWNSKVMNTGDNNVYRRGGGLVMMGNGICSNCVFDSCYALHGSGLVGAKEAVKCEFLRNNNNANNNGCATYDTRIIRDSLFEDNARGAVNGCDQMLSNCVFRINRHNQAYGLLYRHTGSIIDCTFSNNTSVCIFLSEDSKRKYIPSAIVRCRFEDNTCTSPYHETAGIGGTISCTTPISNCTFVGVNQINDFSGKISDCRFIRKSNSNNNHFLKNCLNVEGCEFTMETIDDGGAIDLEGKDGYSVSVVSNCVLTRCYIHGINLYNGWVCLDVPAMTNCLVEGNSFWGYSNVSYFGYSREMNAEVVNCTVVSNNGAQGFWNAGSGIITFRNTLFFNNKIAGKSWRQRDISDAEGMGNETIRMVNSFYKSPTTFEGSDSSNMYGRWDWYPQFLKDVFPNETHAHPYALHRKSPCVDAGANGDWTVNDLDLAGNKRSNGDAVDIGCYENWDRIPGLIMLMK